MDEAGTLSPDLTISLHTKTRVTCFGPSDAGQGPNTLRCSGPDAIFLACARYPTDVTLVACLDDVWDKTASVYSTNSPVERIEAPGRPVPLALETSDGSRYRLRSEPTYGRTDGLAAAYHCAAGPCGADAAYVLSDGDPIIDRSAPLWEVLVGDLKEGDSAEPTRRTVVQAWYIKAATSTVAEPPPAECPEGIVLPKGVDPRACGGIPDDAVESGLFWETQDGQPSGLWRAPSGNITCQFTADEVDCGAAESVMKEKTTVPRADGWCSGYALREGKPKMICGSELMLWDLADRFPAKTLEYGESVYIGNRVCAIKKAGLTCWNATTGHGFFLSRSRYASW
ncbi:MAG: hypothetical protein QM713_14535 [Arachnia sp.]